MGTAGMGADPARSVVNEWGRNHDLKNLFNRRWQHLCGTPPRALPRASVFCRNATMLSVGGLTPVVAQPQLGQIDLASPRDR